MLEYYYVFPFHLVEKGAKIVIYGAGEVGQWYLAQMEQTGYADVVAIADKDWDIYPEMNVPLIPPGKICEKEFDRVLVAFEKKSEAQDVAITLVRKYKLPEEKILLGCESRCVIPEPSKSGTLPVLAYQPRNISVAIYIEGGLGDMIINHRKIDEIMKWDERIRVDLYVPDMRHEIVRSFYQEAYEGRLQSILFGGYELYAKQKSNYAFALRFPQALDLTIDAINENVLGVAPYLLERCLRLQDQCKAYGNIDVHNTALHYMRCLKDGLNCYTSLNRYDGFNVEDFHTQISLHPEGATEFAALKLKKYITISCGGTRIGEKNAKEWPKKNFDEFVSLFKQSYPEIEIVQIDGKGFEVIDGCDHYIIGKSIELAKYILRYAVLHVGLEGGLVHLASQLDTKCIVLCGPARPEYYGYQANVNIQAGNCHGCVWLVPDWYSCYRQLPQPECMMAITPALVMENVEKCLSCADNNSNVYVEIENERNS